MKSPIYQMGLKVRNIKYLDSDRAKDYPYLIVSNHPRWRVHANMDDVWFREIETCKVKGPDGYYYEPVWINPVDKTQCKDGDVVSIFERGRVLAVYVTGNHAWRCIPRPRSTC